MDSRVIHRPPLKVEGAVWTLDEDGYVLKDEVKLYANWRLQDLRRVGRRLIGVGFSGRRYVMFPDTGRVERWDRDQPMPVSV